MTHEQHDNEAKRLKGKATRLRNKAKAQVFLADKVELLRQAKAVDAELQEHRLAYYQLVR